MDVPFVRNRKWIVSRDPDNDRGDEATLAERAHSVTTIGIVQNLRCGAWLFPIGDNVVGPRTEYAAMHWASLTEGAERAWKKDEKKTNLTVQASISIGLKRCTIFSNKMPNRCKLYLKELGNRLNPASTGTTILEKYRASPAVQAAWVIKADENGWQMEAVGQVVREEKKSSLHVP